MKGLEGHSPAEVDRRVRSAPSDRGLPLPWHEALAPIDALKLVDGQALSMALEGDIVAATWIFALDEPPELRMRIAVARAWRATWTFAQNVDEPLSAFLGDQAAKIEELGEGLLAEIDARPAASSSRSEIGVEDLAAFVASVRALAEKLAPRWHSVPPAELFDPPDEGDEEGELSLPGAWADRDEAVPAPALALQLLVIRLVEIYSLNTGEHAPLFHNNVAESDSDVRFADFIDAAGTLCGLNLPDSKNYLLRMTKRAFPDLEALRDRLRTFSAQVRRGRPADRSELFIPDDLISEQLLARAGLTTHSTVPGVVARA